MRSLLARLRTSLSGLLPPPRPKCRPRRARPLCPEWLEERTVPSAVLPAGFPGCSDLPARGDAYTLGGGVDGTSPYAVKWAQPAGLGTPVTITYSYSNLLNGSLGGGLPAATIKAAIEEALSRWAAVSPLRFVEVPDAGPPPSPEDYDPTGKPMLRFGDRPVDGPYGVLAYGYYPGGTGLAGDVQFDSSEPWSVNPALGEDLIEVAMHEIGHTLGLAHSQVAPAIMDAYYSGYFHGPGTSYLFADDIAGVQALYGAGVGSVTPLAPPVFTLVGTTLYVRGTAGNDTFEFQGARGQVGLNGLVYAGSLSAVRSVVFDGSGGSDRAIVIGTTQAESFSLRPGQLVMTGPTWNLTVVNTARIEVAAGREDQVTMTGTLGNDAFVVTPGAASVAGGGCSAVVQGFASASAAGGGGSDLAYLYGTAGNDTLTGGPGITQLQGAGYSLTVRNVRTVCAYGRGGADAATLSDSPGNDLFTARPGVAAIQGPGSSYVVLACGFARVQATSSGGADVARLFGSAGADTLTATATNTALETATERWEVRNFAQVYADGQGGGDTAYLYDSAGGDTFTGQGKTGTLAYSGSMVQFVNFPHAVAYGTSGGVNRRSLGAMAFSVDWVGTWV
jgi:hypothetical protein